MCALFCSLLVRAKYSPVIPGRCNTVQHWQLRDLIHVPEADHCLYYVHGGATWRLQTETDEVSPRLISRNLRLLACVKYLRPCMLQPKSSRAF